MAAAAPGKENVKYILINTCQIPTTHQDWEEREEFLLNCTEYASILLCYETCLMLLEQANIRNFDGS